MKICFFSVNRLAFVGGAEKYILEVSREFRSQGHEIFYLGDCRPLLTLNVLAGLFSQVSSVKKTVRDLISLTSLPSFPPDSRSYLTPIAFSVKALLPFTKERRGILCFLTGCQAVFVKNEFLDMLTFSFLTLFNRGIKPALIVFSSFSYPSSSWRGILHNIFYSSFLYRLMLRRYDRIVVSNSLDMDILKSDFMISPNRLALIPYGLSPSEFNKIDFPKEDGDIFRILFVGRLEEQKGVDYLISIIKTLSSTTFPKRLHFTVIGDGPMRDEIINLAKDYPNLEFKGEIPRDEVLRSYFLHDLIVVTSRWETFSYVTLEAQFSGLPVVSFNIAGPKDIISDRMTGRLVKLGDIESFVEAVGSYIRHPFLADLRKKIASVSQDKFSLRRTCQSLISAGRDTIYI